MNKFQVGDAVRVEFHDKIFGDFVGTGIVVESDVASRVLLITCDEDNPTDGHETYDLGESYWFTHRTLTKIS